MFVDTQPASLGHDGSVNPWGPFRVHNATERDSLLRQLRDGSIPVCLNSPQGHSMTTALWSFDPAQERLVFSASEKHPQLQNMVDADEAVAVAYLDSVKLQFEVAGMLLVRSARSCALQALMPRELYRFQRRVAYRVRTLERSTPVARVRHPSLPDMNLTLRVLDVSIGGCALHLPGDVPKLQPGTLIQGVRVELDGDTRFAAALQFHHASSQPSGGLRLGCEWQQIDGDAQRALQRYIDQTQKRRRLLSLG